MPQQSVNFTDEQIELAKRIGKVTGKNLSASIVLVFELGIPHAIEYCSKIQVFQGRTEPIDALLSLVIRSASGQPVSDEELTEIANELSTSFDREDVLEALITVRNLVKRKNGHGHTNKSI